MFCFVLASSPSCSTPSPTTPRKERLRKANQRLRTKVSHLSKKGTVSPAGWKSKKSEQYAIDLVSNYLSGTALEFFKTQIALSGRRPRGNRWSEKSKMFALSLFYISPKCYRLLKKIFSLPCVKTLKKWVRNLDIKAGFHQSILNGLKIKSASMSERSKLCAVVFDEMTIKEYLEYNAGLDKVEGLEDLGDLGQSRYIANHASVFMLRGLVEKWKQPIGYFLSSGPLEASLLKSCLFSCIEKVRSTGLTPRVVILDQGSNNRAMINALGVSTEDPTFEHDGQKLHVFYDPPHLLQNIRNNFKKHGFEMNGHRITWEYVEKFYDIDSSLPIRMAPKLSAKHIDLPPFSAMNVRLAAQVLSHSVSAGITTLCLIGNSLPPDAIHTAHFIEKFDNIFNVFNSATLTNAHKFRCAISETSDHVAFLKDSLNWLDSVKSLGKHKTLPCLEGWKLTITSLLCLWKELKSQYDLAFLLTNRLNQDCLENFFSIIRGRGGHRDNPNAVQFKADYRSIAVDTMFSSSMSSNCQEDMDGFLLQLSNVTEITPSPAARLPPNELPSNVTDLLTVSRASPELNLSEENIIVYLAGYLIRKTLKKFPCHKCEALWCQTGQADGKQLTFLNVKQYNWLQGGGLVTPTEEMQACVSDMEILFREQSSFISHTDKIRTKFVTKSVNLTSLEKITCSEPACQISQKYMTELYFIVRIHHSLRATNRNLRCSGNRRNRKVMKFQHI